MLSAKNSNTLAWLFIVALIGIHADVIPTGLGVGLQLRGLSPNELNTCEGQLAKYRKFILQSVFSFGDLCEGFDRHSLTNSGAEDRSMYQMEHDGVLFNNFQPSGQQTEMWTLFKLLIDQFNDLGFTKLLHDAVIENCRLRSQMQLDEKRNSMVLGKKQRFHSWGGKRALISLDQFERLSNGE